MVHSKLKMSLELLKWHCLCGGWVTSCGHGGTPVIFKLCWLRGRFHITETCGGDTAAPEEGRPGYGCER